MHDSKDNEDNIEFSDAKRFLQLTMALMYAVTSGGDWIYSKYISMVNLDKRNRPQVHWEIHVML